MPDFQILRKLPHLSSLNLMDTKVTDAGIISLQRLPTLKRIEIGPGTTKAGAIQLKKTLPKCDITYDDGRGGAWQTISLDETAKPQGNASPDPLKPSPEGD